MLDRKIKKKWLRMSIYIFIGLILFIIISWFLTATIGIEAVKKEHEAFLKYHYEHCKEAYKKEPDRLGKTWTTPQMGVTARSAAFWRNKLFKEKRYPSFDEWGKFYSKRNSVFYSVLCPFLIEANHQTYNHLWMKEYYFWFFWYTQKYKHDILVFID